MGEADSENSKQSLNEAGFWPPFPWPRELLPDCGLTFTYISPPAWGDDDDEDKPEPKKSARQLAQAVVHFEREMARASLDLCVTCLDITRCQWLN